MIQLQTRPFDGNVMIERSGALSAVVYSSINREQVVRDRLIIHR